jgi:hypothetical protein
MRRREFLKTSLAAVGSMVVGVRCGSDAVEPDVLDVTVSPSHFPQSPTSGVRALTA